MGVKQILLMMVAVVLVGCGTTKIDSNAPLNISDSIVEAAVLKSLNRTQGVFTNGDLAKVTALHLYNSLITDKGLKEVGLLQNLKNLDLSHNRITDAGLRELVKLQKLEEVNLTGTKVTKAGVVELQKALPNCQIFGP